MCPLIAAPARGYPDYQRVDNYDTGVLFSAQTVAGGVLSTPNALDVSRFACTTLSLNNPVGICQVSMSWFDDPGQLTLMGTRSFVLDSNITNPAQPTILNLGPFLTIQVGPVAGSNYSLAIRAVASNRVVPVEFHPFQPVVITTAGQNIGGGAAVIVYPTDYFAGPCNVYAEISTANGRVLLECETATGTWPEVGVFEISTAAELQQTMIMPPGAWRLHVVNQAVGAGTFNLSVVPSLTGAS